jgi:hypothetical protein
VKLNWVSTFSGEDQGERVKFQGHANFFGETEQFFRYSTNRHFGETYLISIGNHRWSFFLTYYSLFRIFSSSQSEFLSLTDGDGVAQDVINTYNYNLKTAYLRDIKSPLLDDRKI